MFNSSLLSLEKIYGVEIAERSALSICRRSLLNVFIIIIEIILIVGAVVGLCALRSYLQADVVVRLS